MAKNMNEYKNEHGWKKNKKHGLKNKKKDAYHINNLHFFQIQQFSKQGVQVSFKIFPSETIQYFVIEILGNFNRHPGRKNQKK